MLNSIAPSPANTVCIQGTCMVNSFQIAAEIVLQSGNKWIQHHSGCSFLGKMDTYIAKRKNKSHSQSTYEERGAYDKQHTLARGHIYLPKNRKKKKIRLILESPAIVIFVCTCPCSFLVNYLAWFPKIERIKKSLHTPIKMAGFCDSEKWMSLLSFKVIYNNH